VADNIAKKIKDFSPTPEQSFVLGLPTGSPPLGIYKKLIEYYKKGLVSFKNVILLIWMSM
jgi:glucosamine-6-phosphate deaminase